MDFVNPPFELKRPALVVHPQAVGDSEVCTATLGGAGNLPAPPGNLPGGTLRSGRWPGPPAQR